MTYEQLQHAVRVACNVSDELNCGYSKVHDLAVSKLAAPRPQDRNFVRALMVHSLVDVEILLDRINDTEMNPELKTISLKWVQDTQKLL